MHIEGDQSLEITSTIPNEIPAHITPLLYEFLEIKPPPNPRFTVLELAYEDYVTSEKYPPQIFF